MKTQKIIARIGLGSMFATGVIVIASEFLFLEKMTNLSPYIFWGFGVMPILLSLLFLYREYQKPKEYKLKKNKKKEK